MAAVIVPRLTRLSLLALAAVVATGCGTVSDNDVAARVEGTELTNDEFAELVASEELAGIEEQGLDGLGLDALVAADNRAPRAAVDVVLYRFVATQLLRSDLAALGAEVLPSAPAEGASPFAGLDADFGAAAQSWIGLPPEQLLDDAVVARYSAGPGPSGIICPAHILTDTRDAAEDAIARVDSGVPFGEVAATLSTDAGSGMNGGQLGCVGVDEFQQQYIPEFVEAALNAEVGVMTQPVESQFGFHVIRLVPLDELAPEERDSLIVPIRFSTLSDRYEVSIDPRYGVWSTSGRVVPVG